ncbi:MAG: hypothetical protein ACFFD4_12295 [Candidatus Odinarchaeota archaeon]
MGSNPISVIRISTSEKEALEAEMEAKNRSIIQTGNGTVAKRIMR